MNNNTVIRHLKSILSKTQECDITTAPEDRALSIAIEIIRNVERNKTCSCDDRSWYGDTHDSACDFAGRPRD